MFPDDITAITDAELADLITALEAEFDRAAAAEQPDLAALTALADQIDSARTESTSRDEARDAEVAELEALMTRVHPAEATDTPTEPEGDDGDGDGEPEGEDADASAAPVAVAASASRVPARPRAAAVAARSPRTPAPAPRPLVTITAAADVPDIATGARMDVTRLAQGFHDRARGLNDGGQRVPVGRVHIPYAQRLGRSTDENLAIVAAAVGPNSHDAAALVASGGWCAPSQPILDLFEVGDADGLLDLPSAGAVRGGVLVPSFFGFGDTAGALWNWTEAMDIDAADNNGTGDVTKPCLKIPCPTWTDVRLEAEGLCVTHGNLSDRAYPELTRSFVNTVVNAHLHRLSAAKIAKIAGGATAVAFAGERSDAAGDLLSAIELSAQSLRSQYRASRTRSVDVLLPDWTIGALRASVAMRAGVDLLSVSDADVIGWLTMRSVRPQFLADYLPLYTGAANTDWPTTVKFLLFFSGAYLDANGGEIDLGVVRDSTLNSTNDFTAAWSEQFFAIAKIGPAAREVTVDLTVDGVTGCCPTTAPA